MVIVIFVVEEERFVLYFFVYKCKGLLIGLHTVHRYIPFYLQDVQSRGSWDEWQNVFLCEEEGKV